jgi:hypothetical protein
MLIPAGPDLACAVTTATLVGTGSRTRRQSAASPAAADALRFVARGEHAAPLRFRVRAEQILLRLLGGSRRKPGSTSESGGPCAAPAEGLERGYGKRGADGADDDHSSA